MELIDLINELKDFRQKGFLDCNVEAILLKLKKIENNKKVKIPKYVAECIEYAQASDWDLEDVFQSISNELDTSEISVWFYSKSENMDTLASAWLYGYEIEKEKRYTVKVKANGKYLNWGLMNIFYFSEKDKTVFTQNKLKEQGFGWVFNCKEMEVKEVKE